MKHLFIKPVKPHRPMLRLFVVIIGAIILQSITFPQNANAINIGMTNQSQNTNTFTLLEQNEQKLDELNNSFNLKQESLEDKADEVEKLKNEASVIISEKDQLENRVASLKQELAELDDMFVRISGYAGNAAGNSYALGNCTWYVKDVRPDLANFMGNANMWYSSAQAYGFKVGIKAKVGAVATTQVGWAGHVAYVEKVSRDGQLITISEMNYGALYQMNTRTVPSSDFKYIYEKS